jgi:hypothetical protein
LYLRERQERGSIRAADPDFGAGVRALHDLLLPRLHLEATICGAVPPFASGFGGKLLATFLSHPLVLASSASTGGELLGWSFNLEDLNAQLPSAGLLCITTKGLYSGHAAIYNRAEMPGARRPLRLQHLANTEGTTTTLISSRTARLARLVVAAVSGDRSAVSQVYGSGGAKRHRAIEAALSACGLSSDMANAGIRRPVYGVSFCSNVGAVVWLGEQPDVLTPVDSSPDQFDREAAALWRAKWLGKACERVSDYIVAPSLVRTLEAAVDEAGVC